MKISYIAAISVLTHAVIGAPIVKTITTRIGADEPIASGVSGVVSVGASVAISYPALFRPVVNLVPALGIITSASSFLGGRFAGAAAGLIAGRTILGFFDSEMGNNVPIIGGIIRNEGEEGGADNGTSIGTNMSTGDNSSNDSNAGIED
ncbi:hypothetical protein LPJ66_001468 [Kickxella alabastrina]|uniref:Uncharacterized protein n=1 Tax=Kickxella alabastrina TaxID=61397 RepID=A0ACC1ITB6_9FUNG|nr:hypothetical protein LPJ66_001468 [Kickxella alabastrina]